MKNTTSSDVPLTTRARVNHVIDEIISDHREVVGKESSPDVMRKELFKLYDMPKVSQLEAVLLKRITEDEARHVIFCPDHEQAAYYKVLIANPPKGAPAGHPQRALQIPHLSLLYLQHWKRWDFVSPFVLAGGLHTLCSLFAHDNPIIRMKAITTLVSITAHRDFDWFLPATRRGEGAGVHNNNNNNNNTIEARLHRALLGLRFDPAFLSGLIANSWGGGWGSGSGENATEEEKEKEGGRTFPGVCLMCLELLAMWLSWVRALHTVDGTLKLSRPLFRAIEGWAGKEGEREGKRRWGKGAWLPALPPKERPRSRGGGVGEGTVVKEKADVIDAGIGAVSLATKGNDATAAVAKGSENGSEAAAEGDRRSAGGGAPAGDLEAEEAALIEAEREERAKVLELSEKLVADFGRFPPAEEEWEGVEEGRGKGSGELLQGGDLSPLEPTAEGGARGSPGQECDDEACGSGDSRGCEKSSHNKPANGDTSSSSEAAETVELPLSACTRKALALKLEGNESYRKGELHAARDAYTAALDMLNGAVGVARSPAAPQENTQANLLETSRTEAAALCGALHRNRAAAALELFNSKAAAAAAAARERKITASHPNCKATPRGGGGAAAASGGSAGATDRDIPDRSSPPQGRREEDRGPSLGTERDRRNEQPGNERSALELALALLEGCESDCLRAIELDPGDRQARLRLNKCRERRRRCYRGGLASAAVGREGLNAGYARVDERLQGRKAVLVAKILARTQGSHEIVGGNGSGGQNETPATTVSASTASSPPTRNEECNGGGTVVSGISGSGDGVLLGDASGSVEPLKGEGSRDVGLDGGSGKGGDREGPPGARAKDEASPTFLGQGGEHVAPWEGGELRGAIARTSAETTKELSEVYGGGNGMVEGDHGISRKGFEKKRLATAAKKNGKHGESSARRSRPADVAAVAARSLRRRLERVCARAAAFPSPTETEHEASGQEKEERKEAAREVWDVLSSVPESSGIGGGGGVSLEKLFGDGITAESLVGIALGLKYAFEFGGGTRNIERASQLFLELARVRRVGLALAMCSAKDRLALKDVSGHILGYHKDNLQHHGQRCQLISSHDVERSNGGGGPEGAFQHGGKEEEDGRWMAFEAAVSTLVVQP